MRIWRRQEEASPAKRGRHATLFEIATGHPIGTLRQPDHPSHAGPLKCHCRCWHVHPKERCGWPIVWAGLCFIRHGSQLHRRLISSCSLGLLSGMLRSAWRWRPQSYQKKRCVHQGATTLHEALQQIRMTGFRLSLPNEIPGSHRRSGRGPVTPTVTPSCFRCSA